jgi:glyoxylase-like metal-dependent hydrolase (beta-lactamase superfamily II)
VETQPLAVAEGIYQVCIPLPFALRIVNCYLLRDDDGWAVVDTGINTAAGRAVWQAAFHALRIRPRDVRRLVVTHVHPDHFGLAGWLQRLVAEDGGELPFYTSPREILQYRWIWQRESDESFRQWLVGQGMPAAMADEVYAGQEDTHAMTLPHPAPPQPIHPGESLMIGQRRFWLLQGGGHSDGQLLLYDADDRLLLCGDHVLMKITPNIGLWTKTEPHPLRRYLASLAELRRLPVRLALPGHKTLITGWQGRVDELLAHHEQRLAHTLQAVSAGCRSPYEVARVIFSGMAHFTAHEWRFALAEALAHLDELAERGNIQRADDGFALPAAP